jgi:hypothetical protein
MVIWYILWLFGIIFHVLLCFTYKNLATLLAGVGRHLNVCGAVASDVFNGIRKMRGLRGGLTSALGYRGSLNKNKAVSLFGRIRGHFEIMSKPCWIRTKEGL